MVAIRAISYNPTYGIVIPNEQNIKKKTKKITAFTFRRKRSVS